MILRSSRGQQVSLSSVWSSSRAWNGSNGCFAAASRPREIKWSKDFPMKPRVSWGTLIALGQRAKQGPTPCNSHTLNSKLSCSQFREFKRETSPFHFYTTKHLQMTGNVPFLSKESSLDMHLKCVWRFLFDYIRICFNHRPEVWVWTGLAMI